MPKFTVVSQISTREEWLLAFARAASDKFAEAGAPLDDIHYRVSIGFPSKGRRSRVIGECFHSTVSADNAREIFIRPSLQSELAEVAGVLTHELIHAALPEGEGHGKTFGKVARALGLEGKLTATTTGDGWWAWARPILDALGPFPGAALNDGAIAAGGAKKQTTRLVKVACGDCGWHFRASRQNIDAITDHTCLACGEGQLSAEG